MRHGRFFYSMKPTVSAAGDPTVKVLVMVEERGLVVMMGKEEEVLTKARSTMIFHQRRRTGAMRKHVDQHHRAAGASTPTARKSQTTVIVDSPPPVRAAPAAAHPLASLHFHPAVEPAAIPSQRIGSTRERRYTHPRQARRRWSDTGSRIKGPIFRETGLISCGSRAIRGIFLVRIIGRIDVIGLRRRVGGDTRCDGG
jgi:hypothetical protein